MFFKEKEFKEIKTKLQKYFYEEGLCKLIFNKTLKPLTLDEKISKVLHKYINEIGLCSLIIQQTKDPPSPETLNIPLQFWFNRDPGLALPIVNLAYRDVKINITLSDQVDLQEISEDMNYDFANLIEN